MKLTLEREDRIREYVRAMCEYDIIDDSVDLYDRFYNVMIEVYRADYNNELKNYDEIDVEFRSVEAYKEYCGLEDDEWKDQFGKGWYTWQERMNELTRQQEVPMIKGMKL